MVEMVRSHSALYDDASFVVYNADVWVRSEQFERFAPEGRAGTTQRPGRITTQLSRAGRSSRWPSRTRWNENLHRPAMFHLTRIKWAATAVAEGTAPQDLSVAIEPRPGNTRLTQASTEVLGHLWSSVFPQGKKIM